MSQPDPTLDAIVAALLSIPDTAKRHQAFLELADLLDPPTPREELRRWAHREALNQMSLSELSTALLALSREGMDVVRDRLDGLFESRSSTNEPRDEVPPANPPASRDVGSPKDGHNGHTNDRGGRAPTERSS